MPELVLYHGIRSAMGRFGGSYKDLSPMQLAAPLIQTLLNELHVDPARITEAFLGQCRQAGHGPNPARTAALWGGLCQDTPATTINMACPSGIMAVRWALSQYANSEAMVLVGGMDSMSTIPYLLKGARFSGFKMGDRVLEDGWSDSRDPVVDMNMGQTAEALVDQYNLSRADMDDWAVSSHRRASAACTSGLFTQEIRPVCGLEKDETIRHSIAPEKMAALKPVFRKGGSVTAGNSCAMADAAAVLLVAPEGVFPGQPAFRVRAQCVTAVDPGLMGIGPAQAVKTLLQSTGFTQSDIDILEINEAFAAQILANLQDLNWDPDKLNIRGGAIALGHPTGMSGARILVTLMSQLVQTDKNLGIAAICGAGGVTSAMLLERIQA